MSAFVPACRGRFERFVVGLFGVLDDLLQRDVAAHVAFGEAVAPLAIMFSLPLAVVGGLIGLLVTGLPLDIPAMIGALMLISQSLAVIVIGGLTTSTLLTLIVVPVAYDLLEGGKERIFGKDDHGDAPETDPATA